jgi:SARP family transcriptional regulator, regulator of embCAB operon
MLDIRILGPITVVVNGRYQAIQAKKVRAVLCILALNARRVVSSDELIDELWEEQPPAKARNALQANIRRLRRSLGVHDDLGVQVVQTMNNGYMLNVEDGQIDAYRFQDLVERGRTEATQWPSHAIELLTSALRLWRGPALDDVSGGRCNVAAVQLDELRLAAREYLVVARLAMGDERIVVTELRSLIAQYPGREDFIGQLMVALYRCGRQGEALELFHRARSWLSDELGVEPCVHLRNLYRAILVQDPSLDIPADAGYEIADKTAEDAGMLSFGRSLCEAIAEGCRAGMKVGTRLPAPASFGSLRGEFGSVLLSHRPIVAQPKFPVS